MKSKNFVTYLLLYLTWMLAIFFFTQGEGSWLRGWHHWDARWYESIAMRGYGADLKTLVFPPGFPWAARVVSYFFEFDLASMVLNIFCFFTSVVIATEFLAKRFQVSRTPLFIAQLSFPAAFYAFMAYSDALFILFFWLMIWVVHEKPTLRNQLVLVLLAFLAPMVRITGYALTSWLLVKKWAVAAAFVTLAGLLWFNHFKTGDAFYFLHLQQEFGMPKGGILGGLKYTLSELLWVPPYSDQTHFVLWVQSIVLPLFSSIVILAVAGWLAFKKEWPLFLALVSVAFISRNQMYWRSVFRYDWPLVAIVVTAFFAWAKSENRYLKVTSRVALAVGVACGFVLQVFFARILHGGGWAF